MTNEKAVRIKKMVPLRPMQMANQLIEIGFFAKLDATGYYNNVRANLRIISAGFTAAFVFTFGFWIYSSLAITLNPSWPTSAESVIATSTIGFLTLWTGLFWNEKVSIHKKWEYLASLYNEILRTDFAKKSEYPKRALLENALALDILQLEMWSHESYAEFFRTALEEAIHVSRERSEADWICKGLSSKGILANEAKEYLLIHQEALLEKAEIRRRAS